MGYSYKEAMFKASIDYEVNNLYNYDNYKKFILQLKNEINILNDKTEITDVITTNNGPMSLKKSVINYYKKEEEYEQQIFHSEKGYGYKTTIKLKNIPVDKYFKCTEEEKKAIYSHQSNIEQIKQLITTKLNTNNHELGKNFELLNIEITDKCLTCYTLGSRNEIEKILLSTIRDYYEKNSIHITRMFGSYILIINENNKLKAIKATPIPIKYCPLMVKLLKEVGGELADELLKTLMVEDEELQTKMMCNLINKVVISGGYFDTNRPLNSCEANVLFGASETIASAFEAQLIDAAVIVSNNLGTIITTNSSNTQGAVKRMTGLFYTSPSKELVDIAKKANIIPVFPYTAEIDQIAGVKKAIALGYKNIAVSVAAADNHLHKELKTIEEENNINIYKFGLCSTGIDEQTAIIMKNNADIIWSCASKQVKEHIEPAAIAQVGLKIPVHVMTKNGWKLIKNHLQNMSENIELNNIELRNDEDKAIFVNDKDKIKVLKKREIHQCTDCPHPCI